MTELKTNPLVWVQDNAGNRFLCPMDQLRDANSVSEAEKQACVHDASELVTRKSVPSNEPEGKIKFAESKSPS